MFSIHPFNVINVINNINYFIHFSLVVSQSYRAAGVFLLIEGEIYTLNFTAARDACLSLNVTIATEIQMTQALQHGLETCK